MYLSTPPPQVRFILCLRTQIHLPEAASYFFGTSLFRAGLCDTDDVSPAVDGSDDVDSGDEEAGWISSCTSAWCCLSHGQPLTFGGLPRVLFTAG